MKMVANSIAELRHILNILPDDADVSFAGELGLAVFLHYDNDGRAVVSIDSISYDLPDNEDK